MLQAFSSFQRSFASHATPIIGIDLGTTNSCVAVVEKGVPKAIANSVGSTTTPSVVAFTPNDTLLVGDTAKRQLITNPASTFFATKRIIGRRFNDPLIPTCQAMVPYAIVEHDQFAWLRDGSGRTYSPSQVASFVLCRMKQTAEVHLGHAVESAIVTVPAYFNDAQRQATKDGGRIAGLHVARVMNEPTAAALAYGIQHKHGQMVAVFDLGGGTFDISILEIASDGVFEVKATNGDTFLGGEDFDAEIIRHLVAQFRRETGVDLAKDTAAMQRIREAAERAKCELSRVEETEIILPYIAAGARHLRCSLKRTEYERMTRQLLQRTLAPCIRCLKDAGVKPANIGEVVMVGGMTRTPSVLQTVRELFHREPFTGVNPDEVVALGAAIQGSFLASRQQQRVLIDVTPLSLGIETMGGIFARLIPRNSVVPCKMTETFSTAVDGQTNVRIRVFQGERELVSGNRLLGDFTLEGITPLPRGVPRITVAFEIDANAIVHVKAFEEHSGKTREIMIKQSGGLTENDILQMVEDAKKYEREDTKNRLLIERKLDLENFIITVQRMMAEYLGLFPEELVRVVKEGIGELEEAIKTDSEKNMDDAFKALKKQTDKMHKLVRETPV
jgi:molecular chaperone DnaK